MKGRSAVLSVAAAAWDLRAAVRHRPPPSTPAAALTSVLALIDTREVSGPCRGLFQLAKLSEGHGVAVTLGMFARPGARLPAIEETRRRGIPLAVLVQRRRYDPGLVPQAWQVIRAHGVRVLQSHGYKPACVAWCLKRMTGLPWVAFCHGFTSENGRMALYNRLDRWLLRRADRVVVMSEVMAQLFRQGGADPARVRVVHNAVDPGEFARRGDGTAFRVECGAGGGPLIGVIGRFSSEKGQAMLLRALPEIRRRHPAAKAVLVGDGIDRDRLQRLVRDLDLCDAVTFAGYRRDLSPVYAALDLVVLPSLSEGLPNVLLEAFVHRKPVVATAVGAVPDVMRGPLAQWLAPPGDPAALAHAVSSALSDPAGLEAAAAHGYQEARERFSPERRVERIVDLYQEVLGEPR